MKYVKCVNNRAYIVFEDKPLDPTEITDLTIGLVYKAVPPTEDDRRLGELRVYDDTGEDYLFPASYFESYLPNGDVETADSLSISVDHESYRKRGESILRCGPDWTEPASEDACSALKS